MPFIKTLVYANVFISLCSFAQVILTYHLFHIEFNFSNVSYLFFVLLSTFIQYNVQRGYMITENNLHDGRSQWLLKHKKALLYSVGLALFIVLFLCNNLSWTSIGIMVGAELVSTLYYLPPFNLRKHGYIKPFLVSAIWVISCALVPLIENQILNKNALLFIISQFCFISVLCLLFDIKDSANDYLLGVNTYANKFGTRATKFICYLFILFGFIAFYRLNINYAAHIAILIYAASLLLIVVATADKKSNFYYYLLVDGLLILQAILFIIF